MLVLQFPDIDECVSPEQCGRGGMCQNTAGSYTCRCSDGYILEENICTGIFCNIYENIIAAVLHCQW